MATARRTARRWAGKPRRTRGLGAFFESEAWVLGVKRSSVVATVERRSSVAVNGFGSDELQRIAEAGGNPGEEAAVVEEEEAEGEDEVVEEGVVGGEDDADFPGRDDAEADEADTAGEEKHPDDGEFHDEGAAGGADLEPVGQMLDVPADEGGQGTVLVVLVHRGEVTPLGIAGEQLDDAGFEIDAEPLPLQEEECGARRRGVDAPAGPESARREEEGEEAGFKEHAVGLVAGEVAGGRDEGQEADEAEEEAEAWPDVEEGEDGGNEAGPDDDHHRVGAGGIPEEGGRVPETQHAGRLALNGGEEVGGGQDAVWADEAFDLKDEREERGEVDAGKSAEEDPAGRKAIARAGVRVEEPAEIVTGCVDHGAGRRGRLRGVLER